MRKGVFVMTRLFMILLTVIVAMTVMPQASFARDHEGRGGYDREWKHRHEQVWRVHEREWRGYDREWAAHRGDRYWRERHMRMWPEWYRWHREEASYLNVHMSSGSHDGSGLEIDFGVIR